MGKVVAYLERNKGLEKLARDTKIVTPGLMLLLATAVIGGSFSFLILFLDLPALIHFFAKAVLFVGLVSLVFLVYFSNFFKAAGEKQKITTTEKGVDFLASANFEVVSLFSGVDEKNIVEILARNVRTKRASFVLSEIGLTDAQIGKIGGTISGDLQKVLTAATQLALDLNREVITAADLLYGFMATSGAYHPLLAEIELSDEDIRNIVFWSDSLFDKIEKKRTFAEKVKNQGAGVAEGWSSGYTLYLDRFGRDISHPKYFSGYSAKGRENIIGQIEAILSKGGRSNCILVGETGVGKSGLIYALAEKIYWGETLPELAYKRIVKIDTGALLSGVKSDSELEDRLIRVLNDAVRAGNVIVFIDDIQTLFSSGEQVGAADVSGILNPYLESSSLIIVGATTPSAFETYIAPRPAGGQFEKVIVEEADEKTTMMILEDLSFFIKQKYGVGATYGGLKEVYKLSQKLMGDKGLPARAVDLIENLAANMKKRGIHVMDKSSVDSMVGETYKVPVAEAQAQEKDTLLNLEQKLHERVIGQDEAVVAVADALRRARVQLTEKNRPIGTFLFLGPTGVGKTELTKALAWAYFGSEEDMIRVDMNEYQDPNSAEKFIGRKLPGKEELEGGSFVKKVKQKPFTVVLLDEIEKAHPDVLNIFLQILDEGYITDGLGRKISFLDTIIIGTSNAGANLIREGLKSGISQDKLKGELLEKLQDENLFRPEFLNRFDGVVLFKPLEKEQLLKIGQLLFGGIQKNMAAKGYTIELSPDCLTTLVDQGYQPEFGARPMRRVFQDRVESLLAKRVLEGGIQKGQKYVISASDILPPK